MGRLITDQEFLRDISSFKNFIPLFRDLVKRTMFLVNEGFFHGDIHLWNVVVDRKNGGTGRGEVMKLHLIDYDEAKIGGIDKRIPMAGNERHKRRYVQSLRQNRETCKAYSRNQIVNLFCECWELLFEKNETVSNVKKATNAFMRKYYARFEDVMEDISGEEVDEFYHKMSQVLTIWEHNGMEDNSGEDDGAFVADTKLDGTDEPPTKKAKAHKLFKKDDETEDSSGEEVNESVESLLGESIATKVTIS